MKILGGTQSGYLVDIDEHEMEMLAGFGRKPIGTEVQISDLWRTLEYLRSNRQEVRDCAFKLKQMADYLSKAAPEVTGPIKRALRHGGVDE